jgi:hypothetical protein
MDVTVKLANLSARMCGAMSSQSDELERIKNDLVECFGFPSALDNLAYATLWTSLDSMVCRMRELVSEWDKTNSEVDR